MDEADATAICAAFDKGGEQAAAVELQQRFPALTIERARLPSLLPGGAS